MTSTLGAFKNGVGECGPTPEVLMEGAYQKCQTKATQPAQDDFLMLVRKRVEKIAFQIALVLSAAKASNAKMMITSEECARFPTK